MRIKGHSSIGGLSNSLVSVKCFSDLITEWRELADLTGASEADVSFQDDPVIDIINLWSSKSNHTADVNELVEFLKKMRRWDQMKDVLNKY